MMDKPSEYKLGLVVSQQISWKASGDDHSEGILHIGRVVWIEEPAQGDLKPESTIKAYAEGIGLVLLNPSALKPISE